MQKEIIQLNSISDLGHMVGFEIHHPLVDVIRFEELAEHKLEDVCLKCDFYVIMFKRNCYDRLKWGCQPYDFQEGSLICLPPRLTVDFESASETKKKPEGWALFVHPDLIRGSLLAGRMKDYTFFSYDLSEALHLSEKERSVLDDCVRKIETELTDNMDDYSQMLILSNIELLLNYCMRYYGRQFITRTPYNHQLVAKARDFMNDYLCHKHNGWRKFPTASVLADHLHLSVNYLSDLLKKEVNMNAKDFIHHCLMEEAKYRLRDRDKTINEISFDLGFEYPQYFIRLFKSKTGLTPLAYRQRHIG